MKYDVLNYVVLRENVYDDIQVYIYQINLFQFMKFYNYIFVLKVFSLMIFVLQFLNEIFFYVKQVLEMFELSVSREYMFVLVEFSCSVFDGVDICIFIRYVCGYLYVFQWSLKVFKNSFYCKYEFC